MIVEQDGTNMTYIVNILENDKIIEQKTFEDEDSFGFEVAEWFGYGYVGNVRGNVAVIHQDRNIDYYGHDDE